MTTSQRATTPLHWGTGATVFEMFIEPTCPFSVTAIRKLEPLLAAVGDDNVTVKLRLLSQPWHLFSPVVSRCVLAATTLANGHAKAWAVLSAVGAHREAFVLENHCTGPNRTRSPADIISQIENDSDVTLGSAFTRNDVTAAIKWHAKYARQNGIHSTPTFMLNGLVQPSMGSGDSVQQWAEAILAA